MKVRCITNIPGDGDLEIGKAYTIYGILFEEGRLKYLLSDSSFPSWHLARRFEFINELLPPNFYFSFDKSENIGILSYKEMALQEDHFIELVECVPKAREIFAKRKKQIDEYEELRKINE